MQPSGYGRGQQQAGGLRIKKMRKQLVSDYCFAGLERASIARWNAAAGGSIACRPRRYSGLLALHQ
ncbi:unnamed protein product [Fusarium graminearum]|nr:unnamed protein product [Fusarium graminearum]